MKIRGSFLLAALFAAATSLAANTLPLAEVWNIQPTGSAASSGELVFRVTAGDTRDPVEVVVPVISGASDRSVAGSIRRALSSQLPRERYKVESGEGANILVSDSRGRPDFSIELVSSDIDNLRVAVQSVSPAASPTVPRQAEPAPTQNITPPPSNPPGDAVPPPDTRAPRPPPNDMPSPREEPPVPGPDGIPLPAPKTPDSSTTIPIPPPEASPPPSKPRL